MRKKAKDPQVLVERPSSSDCCKIESLVTVDERGQMVLPKELRDRADIRPGDKLAIISWQKDGQVCCFTLIKANSLEERVREFLGPVLKMFNPE